MKTNIKIIYANYPKTQIKFFKMKNNRKKESPLSWHLRDSQLTINLNNTEGKIYFDQI